MSVSKLNKSLSKIALCFDGGTEHTVEKGFVCEFGTDEKEEEMTATIHLLNVSDKELTDVVFFVLELADKLNLFDKTEGAENEQS